MFLDSSGTPSEKEEGKGKEIQQKVSNCFASVLSVINVVHWISSISSPNPSAPVVSHPEKHVVRISDTRAAVRAS